ncbi:MAG: hypothetical protein HOC95_01040, partial [Candidatus Diapherotrites archaeon]|nr:hypothetical protein [Candidatus Diapherotrites archaeon]
VEDKLIVSALEDMVSRKYIGGTEGLVKVSAEMKRAIEKGADQSYINSLLVEAKTIVDQDWFREVYSQSKELAEFYENYKKLK